MKKTATAPATMTAEILEQNATLDSLISQMNTHNESKSKLLFKACRVYARLEVLKVEYVNKSLTRQDKSRLIKGARVINAYHDDNERLTNAKINELQVLTNLQHPELDLIENFALLHPVEEIEQLALLELRKMIKEYKNGKKDNAETAETAETADGEGVELSPLELALKAFWSLSEEDKKNFLEEIEK